jgi:hypothetical protein
MPEIIEHGVTGFIAENEAEAIDVIGRIPTLDRRRVRAAFEQRFTARRMAECYRCCFEHLLAGGNAWLTIEPRKGERGSATPCQICFSLRL